MKRLLLAAAFAASLCLPVHAQDAGSPEALQAAQELATIMTGDTIGQMSSALTAQIWPSIQNQFGNKVDPATLAELRSEFERTLTDFTGQVTKDAPTVYARYFTAQELREMIAFYKSPTGAKALHTMPKVMTDVSTEMQPHMQAFQHDLNTRIAGVMQKHGYKN
jgi:hypothetical protein